MIWLLVDSRTVGGIERHVAILAEALRRGGQPSTIVLLAKYPNNPWLRQLDDARLPYVELDGTVAALLKAVSQSSPDLIHTHGYKANIVGRGVAKLTGTPVVSTFHSGERGPFPVNVYQWLDSATSFLGERVAVSAEIQKALPFKSHLLKNFLLASPSPPEGPLPRRIGFVGRLSHEKGPDRFCQLARKGHKFGEWHIFGDGPMRGELETEYGRDVVFHGLVTDLAQAYRSLGLLVMPSRAEGLPMAALEALEAGIPIVASAVGGLPSLITHGANGWLFKADDLAAAEAALADWSSLDDAAQKKMRRFCWSMVRETYSESRQLPAILDIYRRAGFNGMRVAVPAA